MPVAGRVCPGVKDLPLCTAGENRRSPDHRRRRKAESDCSFMVGGQKTGAELFAGIPGDQLFINDEGTLILFQIIVSPASLRGTAICRLFGVSDVKLSGYDVIELDTPQINSIPGEGSSFQFSYGSPAATAMYEAHFTNFVYGLQDELGARGSVYMIADCYWNPACPALYSDTEQVAVPNFEDKTVADKYTWDYATGLFD